MREFGQTDALKRSHREFFFFGAEHTQRTAPARDTAQPADQYVSENAQPANQIELLKDVADIDARLPHLGIKAAGRLNTAPQYLDGAGGVTVAAGQACQMAQQCGLP